MKYDWHTRQPCEDSESHVDYNCSNILTNAIRPVSLLAKA